MRATRSIRKASSFLLSLWTHLPAAYPIGCELPPKPGEHRIVFGGRVIIQKAKPSRHEAKQETPGK
jgi:hypothetical protein